MKTIKPELPEFLLCEDPMAENENLFIYHVTSRSLVHIVHTDHPDNVRTLSQPDCRHFDFTYQNNLGTTHKITFFAEIVDESNLPEQDILARCAHWYACYLGWEADCNDISAQN